MEWKNAIELRNTIIKEQDSRMQNGYAKSVSVLFNKGRYFETSVYDKDLIRSMSKAVKVKIQYDSMLMGNPSKLSSLVKAFNKRGIHVNLTLDWI